jgi:hypothetical protein
LGVGNSRDGTVRQRHTGEIGTVDNGFTEWSFDDPGSADQARCRLFQVVIEVTSDPLGGHIPDNGTENQKDYEGQGRGDNS